MLDLDLKNGVNPLKTWPSPSSQSLAFLPFLTFHDSFTKKSPKWKKSIVGTMGGGGWLFAAKTLDFESLVKVKFLRDWPLFLGKDQAWSELQLVNFIEWSEFSKYLGRALKVELFYFSQQELLYRKISIFETTEKKS